jgi:hypothetical protein
MWSSLAEFTQWYKDAGYPMRPPTEDPIYITDHSYSAIVYREGRYQVELYMLGPNWSTPTHSHPGIDHEIIFLNGTVYGYRDGEKLQDAMAYTDVANPDGTNVAFGQSHTFDGDGTHIVGTGPKGGLIAITQYWPEGIKMSSQSVHYVGEPIGPEHAQYIKVD